MGVVSELVGVRARQFQRGEREEAREAAARVAVKRRQRSGLSGEARLLAGETLIGAPSRAGDAADAPGHDARSALRRGHYAALKYGMALAARQ